MQPTTAILRDIVQKCLSWPLIPRSNTRRSPRRQDNLYGGHHSLPDDIIRRRRRALTVSSQNDLRVASQLDCSLLTKLPAELREQIWRECLAGMTIHLEWKCTTIPKSRVLSYAPCLSPDPESCNDFRGEKGCSRFARSLPEIGMPQRHLLSILLTCRQIYLEAIHLLYEGNTFVATRFYIALYLPRILLPQRLNSIRSFRFVWRIVGPPPFAPDKGNNNKISHFKHNSWNLIWRNLSRMQRLDKLEVKLVVWPEFWEDVAADKMIILLKPVMAVTNPRIFELTLTHSCRPDESPWKELPCQIRRVEFADLFQGYM